MHRINAFRGWKEQLGAEGCAIWPPYLRFRKNEGGIDDFAEGYKTFGFQRPQSSLISEESSWTGTRPSRNGALRSGFQKHEKCFSSASSTIGSLVEDVRFCGV